MEVTFSMGISILNFSENTNGFKNKIKYKNILT